MTSETTLLSLPQKRILEFVASFIEDRGFPPTLAEIARACGILNRSSVDYHLKTLQSKGFLRREECRHRGLEVVSHPFRLPVLGHVSAGAGVIAQEDVEEYITLDRKLSRGANFLLRVRGDSMIGAGILEGDLVQVRRQDQADAEDLVVALVGEEAVVKRLRRQAKAWALHSENPRYSPITSEFQVIGKVVGLIRRYE
jgi:repressor LexA